MKMFPPRHVASRWRPLGVLLMLGVLSGCTVQKKGEGASKKVDIETPLGSLHVNTQVDAKDTGMAVYPGATRAEDDEGKHAANLSIDSSLFGAKVVAIKYRSDDPPDKLLDFYRKQLKIYGEVSECHGNIDLEHGNVRCRPAGPRAETNLVTGTEERQHIVSVKPDGKGSQFALVYVQTRGEKGTL